MNLIEWTKEFLTRRNWRVSQYEPGRIFAEHNFRACPCILLEIFQRRSTGKDEYALHLQHGILVITP